MSPLPPSTHAPLPSQPARRRGTQRGQSSASTIAGIAALITAVGGTVGVLYQTGVIHHTSPSTSPAPGATGSPSPGASASPSSSASPGTSPTPSPTATSTPSPSPSSSPTPSPSPGGGGLLH